MNAKANQEKVRVGLLGVGLMGSAMAHRLLDRGLAVIAWDRDAERLRALEGRGGEPVERPSEVVSGAGVVMIEDWPEDTIWLQMSSAARESLSDATPPEPVTPPGERSAHTPAPRGARAPPPRGAAGRG